MGNIKTGRSPQNSLSGEPIPVRTNVTAWLSSREKGVVLSFRTDSIVYDRREQVFVNISIVDYTERSIAVTRSTPPCVGRKERAKMIAAKHHSSSGSLLV